MPKNKDEDSEINKYVEKYKNNHNGGTMGIDQQHILEPTLLRSSLYQNRDHRLSLVPIITQQALNTLYSQKPQIEERRTTFKERKLKSSS